MKHFYEFGPYRLDIDKRLLLREGEPIALTPKALDTLFVLVENAGSMLEKEELMKKVWPNSFVEEGNLTVNISLIRKSLAGIKAVLDWDWAGAENEYKKAIELNPNYATAHHWYASQLVIMGQMEESLTEIRNAQKLDPLSLGINKKSWPTIWASNPMLCWPESIEPGRNSKSWLGIASIR